MSTLINTLREKLIILSLLRGQLHVHFLVLITLTNQLIARP